MHHTTALITRAGLERIKEYCEGNDTCYECKIIPICKEITDLYPIPYLKQWTDKDITQILHSTRNYMEATFIKTLEQIVKQEGSCGMVVCDECPFSWKYDGDEECCRENNLSLHYEKNARLIERKELAEWLLEIYKGEKE